MYGHIFEGLEKSFELLSTPSKINNKEKVITREVYCGKTLSNERDNEEIKTKIAS